VASGERQAEVTAIDRKRTVVDPKLGRIVKRFEKEEP
jgi:hypothetical protein